MIANLLSFNTVANWLLGFLMLAPAVLIAVTFHEYAHGLAAYRLGDPTAKEQGRLSLNPLRHLDPVGTLMFVIFRFGWGRPVPVDSRYFKRPRWDMALVSLAGPAANFTLAFMLGMVFRLKILALPEALFGQVKMFTPLLLLSLLLESAVITNIVLGIFNLLPIPPLDGSRLVSALLPAPMLKHYQAIEGYGIAIIFLSIFFFPGRLIGLFEPFINFFQQLFLV